MTSRDLHVVQDRASTELRDLPDDDLMLLIRTGREDAFALLIKRHQDLVIGFATRYFADPSLGREIAQDVFLGLWAERERYQPRGKFISYLYRVSRNRCHVVARKSRNDRKKVDNLAAYTQIQEPAADFPLDALVEAERAKDVRSKLTRLPEKTRQVLILRFTHEFSMKEIASLTGMPLGTVKSHLFRGIKRMSQFMKEGQA